MARTHRARRFRRNARRIDGSRVRRFTVYGIIFGLGIFVALATTLDLPTLDSATDRPADLVTAPNPYVDPPSDRATSPEGEDAASVELEPAVAPAADPEPTIEERHITVRRGDTLMKVLRRTGAEHDEAHTAITALKTVFDPRRLMAGQKLTASFRRSESSDSKSKKTGELMSVMVKLDVERSVAANRAEDGFEATEVVRSFKPAFVRGIGRIDDSLFVSARRAGVPAQIIMYLIRMFSWDVDFQREIRRGDRFEILFETFRDSDGRPVKNGDILFASLSLSGARPYGSTASPPVMASSTTTIPRGRVPVKP